MAPHSENHETFTESLGTPATGDNAQNILSNITKYHGEIVTLCDRLEALADGLPHEFNAQDALILARQIVPTICDAHRFEEDVLFNILNPDPSKSDSIERLKFEHWEDEAMSEDLSDALLSYAQSPKPEMVDKLSYMLRGFFDNLRRHIAFEAEYIVPVVQSRLMRDH